MGNNKIEKMILNKDSMIDGVHYPKGTEFIVLTPIQKITLQNRLWRIFYFFKDKL